MPPVMPRSVPWKTSMPPSVTMKEGTCIRATIVPCARPRAAPRTRADASAAASGQPAFTEAIVATAPRRPDIAPTDRSISPVTMTSTIPTERSAVTDI